MADRQLGLQTVAFNRPPRIIGAATTAGPKERESNYGSYIDTLVDDPMMGERTPEKAEHKMLCQTARQAIQQAELTTTDIDYYIGGDLLNQIISSDFCARELGIPFLGIYGACSTMVEGLGLGSVFIDGQFAEKVLVATTSNYQSSERQFRYPIELNIQHKQTSQWTVTGAAAAILGSQGEGPRITHTTFGKVVDLGIKNSDLLGASMAPAASDTICQHFRDTNSTPGDYDLILTGDLGNMGQQLFVDMVRDAGYTLGTKHLDFGAAIYKPHQKAGAGGSGCACVALGILAYVIKEMYQGKYRRVLALGTGALFSPLSYQQGESIAGIAHALVLDNT